VTNERHLMMCVDSDGTDSIFECTVAGCGRRLIFDHVGARLKVLRPGSSSALHHGSTGLVGVTATVE
jgi:hypothetical protein